MVGAVLLGGSGHNLGITPNLDSGVGMRLYYSTAVPLMRLLGRYGSAIENNFYRFNVVTEGEAASSGTLVSQAFRALENGDRRAVNVGECEFLAKRLLSWTIDGKAVTLATPIYVAQLD
jgi:hypothetical protein